MRPIISFLHLALIRLTGALCALALYATYQTVDDWSQIAPEVGLTMIPLALCLIFCWAPVLPRSIASPKHILDLVPLMFIAAVAPAAAVLFETPDIRLLPELSLADPIQAATLAAPLLITGLALIAVPAKVKPASVPQVTARHWIDGRAWRTYVLLDWVLLRLFGLGLLIVGAILYRLIETGRADLATALTFGQPVQIALYVYGAMGLLITVPVFLPAFLRVAKTPGEGLLKAICTIGIAVVLANGVGQLWPVAALSVSPIAIPEMIASIPRASLVLGLQITAAAMAVFAVAVPMIRRKAGLRYDLEGRPILTLSGTELRRLRSARTMVAEGYN